MLKMYGVHPIVARKMRNYAVKQALDELGNDRDPKQIEYIAKRHMLSYTELKQAICLVWYGILPSQVDA